MISIYTYSGIVYPNPIWLSVCVCVRAHFFVCSVAFSQRTIVSLSSSFCFLVCPSTLIFPLFRCCVRRSVVFFPHIGRFIGFCSKHRNRSIDRHSLVQKRDVERLTEQWERVTVYICCFGVSVCVCVYSVTRLQCFPRHTYETGTILCFLFQFFSVSPFLYLPPSHTLSHCVCVCALFFQSHFCCLVSIFIDNMISA